jgi:RHS repeat-associated protein
MSCDVDVTTGEVIQERIDIDLPEAIPLIFSRFYSSRAKHSGVLGLGWRHNYETWAEVRNKQIIIYQGYEGEISYSFDLCDGIRGPRIEPRHGGVVLHFSDGFKRYFGSPETNLDRFPLLGIEDPSGNVVRLEHTAGHLVRISDPAGRQLIFTYNSRGFLIGIDLFHSALEKQPHALVRYHFDTLNHLIAVTDFSGHTESYEYDNHHLVRYINRAGGASNFAYDDRGRCCHSWQNGEQMVRKLTYDEIRKTTIAMDSYGRKTLYRYNDAGRVTEEIDFAGHLRQTILDGNGGVVAVLDSEGPLEGTSSYDPIKRQLVETEPSGNEIVTEFDSFGRMLRTATLPGRFRTHTYDSCGRITTISTPDGATWKFEYDRRGRIQSAVDPLGYEVRISVSDDGLKVRIEDRWGLISEQRYDPLGNLLSEINAAGHRVNYRYDGQDRLCEEILPDGRSIRYKHDGESNLVALTDAMGRTWRFEDDGFGMLVGQIDHLGNKVKFEFDKEENLCRIHNENGEILEILYDDLYNQVEWRFFDGKIERYKYDARGRRRLIIDGNGGITKLEYDENDQIVRQTLPDGFIHDFEWDNASRVVRISGHSPSFGDQSFSFEYNDSNEVMREEHDGLLIEYNHDARGRRIATRDGWGVETIYRRGARSLIETLLESGREFQFRYNPDGALREIYYPNGLRQIFTTDVCGRLVERQLLNHSGRQLAWRSFKHDAADQIVEVRDWQRGGLRYTYDALGRIILVSDEMGNAKETYKYDATGNLIASHRGSAVVAKGDRIVETQGWIFDYDDAGNIIGCKNATESWVFIYDGDGQLCLIQKGKEVVAAYGYDLLNRRVTKNSGDEKIVFLHDDYCLRAEMRNDANIIRYVYLPGILGPIARYIGDRWEYFSFDQLGMPTEVWDEEGNLLCLINAEIYGTNRQLLAADGAEIEVPFVFPGQYWDKETGFCYNGLRYYNPVISSFISPDPLSIQINLNHYTYPRNPLNYSDPMGLGPVFECGADWTPCERWVARMKVEATNRAIEVRQNRKCQTICPGQDRRKTKQREYYENKCGGSPPSSYDVDHIVELQAGGFDKCCRNLAAIPRKLNQEKLGPATQKALSVVNIGQKIPKIAMKGCHSNGKCSKKQKRRIMKRPPKQDCKVQKPISC